MDVIHKGPADLKVTPNLTDYEQSRATFDWSAVPELCAGLESIDGLRDALDHKDVAAVSAIGGALAASVGADFLCYVTPSEHLGLPDLDEDMRQALFGDRRIGPDAAALEIREKYDLSHLPIGTQLRVVVDFQMIGYGKPEYKV